MTHHLVIICHPTIQWDYISILPIGILVWSKIGGPSFGAKESTKILPNNAVPHKVVCSFVLWIELWSDWLFCVEYQSSDPLAITQACPGKKGGTEKGMNWHWTLHPAFLLMTMLQFGDRQTGEQTQTLKAPSPYERDFPLNHLNHILTKKKAYALKTPHVVYVQLYSSVAALAAASMTSSFIGY